MCFDPLQRVTVLYHFTDRRNSSIIRELGGLHALADVQVMEIEVPAPGGNQLSNELHARAIVGHGCLPGLSLMSSHAPDESRPLALRSARTWCGRRRVTQEDGGGSRH